MESFEKCECDVQDREGSVWLNIGPSSFWSLVLSEHPEPTHQWDDKHRKQRAGNNVIVIIINFKKKEILKYLENDYESKSDDE